MDGAYSPADGGNQPFGVSVARMVEGCWTNGGALFRRAVTGE